MNSRREFLKKFGAGAALTLYSRDLFGQALADSPMGRPMETRFKGFADIVLAEGKLAGCSYTDVRFTMNSTLPEGPVLGRQPLCFRKWRCFCRGQHESREISCASA